MRITFPHMGNLEYMLTDLMDRLGVDYVLPPPTTERTLTTGVKYSPEFACLPLKITLGNMMEGLEAGADTVIMAGGMGPCRFGYYGEIQKRLMKGAGYDFDMLIFEPPADGLRQFLGYFKYLAPDLSAWEIWQAVHTAWRKARAIDRLEHRLLATRCYEAERGAATKAWKSGLELIRAADSRREIEEVEAEALAKMDAVALDRDRPVLRVGLLGEFYVLLEPFVNLDMERWLGERGCYLERGCYVTDWIAPHQKNIIVGHSYKEICQAAEPYLKHTVGGEGLPSVGHAVILGRERFDGLLHLFPFTCMPDTIAKSILPKVSQDLHVPILSLVIDEQTGRAGVTTRLEAFLDLMRARQQSRTAA